MNQPIGSTTNFTVGGNPNEERYARALAQIHQKAAKRLVEFKPYSRHYLLWEKVADIAREALLEDHVHIIREDRSCACGATKIVDGQEKWGV